MPDDPRDPHALTADLRRAKDLHEHKQYGRLGSYEAFEFDMSFKEWAEKVGDLLPTLITAAEAGLAAQEREHYEPLAQSACAAVRELLNDAGVPAAAFIDDHVGNLIVLYNQAQERIAELERNCTDKARAWDAIAEKNQRIAELESERERLRVALSRVSSCSAIVHGYDAAGNRWTHLRALDEAVGLARAALREQEGER